MDKIRAAPVTIREEPGPPVATVMEKEAMDIQVNQLVGPEQDRAPTIRMMGFAKNATKMRMTTTKL